MTVRGWILLISGALSALDTVAGAHASEPWASAVVSYAAGSGVDPAYTNPARALGEPSRFTGGTVFPAAVTPFNPAWTPQEIVSIGPGGSLTLEFPRPVINDPLNPFGIDFIIFGNTGYLDPNYPQGIAMGLLGNGEGTVEVSANGTTWTIVPGATADSRFPTLGYLDLTDPYATAPGSTPSDFTRPVDPAFSALGLSFPQIVSAYGGSGGGTGIDIGAAALSEIRFVRISNPSTASVNVDIDAMSIVTPVPAPAGVAIAVSVFVLLAQRRRGEYR